MPQKEVMHHVCSIIYTLVKTVFIKSFSRIGFEREGEGLVKGIGWPKGSKVQSAEVRTERGHLGELRTSFAQLLYSCSKDHHP